MPPVWRLALQKETPHFDVGSLKEATPQDLVAVDLPAKSSTFWGFSGKPNFISPKVKV